LCINSAEQLKIAADAHRHHRIPYMTAIGNHDRPRKETFERLFRPVYHAFTCHNYLVLALPWEDEAADAFTWAQRLLDRLGNQFHVLAGVHQAAGLGDHADKFMGLFHEYNGRGVYMGHYRANQVTEYGAVPIYVIRGSV